MKQINILELNFLKEKWGRSLRNWKK